MTKYFIYFTFIVCLSYSCKKVEYNNQRPTVDIILPKVNTDIILDSTYLFKAHFHDNKVDGLSSYIIRIWNPQIGKNRVIRDPNKAIDDSLIYVDQVYQRANIFGIQDTTIQHGFSVDSEATYNNKSYPIVTGKYQFQVIVMNIDGNMDTTSTNITLIAPIAQ